MIKITNIQEWLKSNKHKANISIDETDCYKWKKWRVNNTIHIFPCVCPVRNEGCVLVEIYHRIWKVHQILQREESYLEAIMDYAAVQNDHELQNQWIEKYRDLSEDLYLVEPSFKVATCKEPYTTQEIKLPLEETKHVLKFKEVYWSHQTVQEQNVK